MEQDRVVSAFRKGKEVCVDLRGKDLHESSSVSWRAAVAKHFDAAHLSFQTGTARIIHDKGTEVLADGMFLLEEDSWSPVGDFYTPSGLREMIDRENENTLELLVGQLRSPMGVVPFVGAGMSTDFGFPGWPKFLTEAAEFHSDPQAVLKLVEENKLIEAASCLAESPDRFQLLVEKSFGRPISEEQARRGVLRYLPMLTTGPIITTNFDRVLETVFQVAGAPFEEFITGVEPDNVIRAMHRNKHVLIKMHGDALDRSARVFTGLEYKKGYKTITKLAQIMFTNRPLLFLGASLDKDRILPVLEKIHGELPGLVHYAVLAAYYSTADLRERRAELDKLGIVPLWYAPGDYKSIELIVADLIQEASTRLVWKPKKVNGGLPLESAMPAPVPTVVRQPSPADVAKVEECHTRVARRLARRIVNGRLAFFLGSGAHVMGQMSARAFYSSIAEEHGIEASELQRAEAAQFIVDHEGRADAWIAAKERLPTGVAQASVVYKFLAELPSLLRHSGKEDASRLWLLTTNYDIMLEKVLDNAQEPFHLLYYQVDGKDAGRFLHREPSGTIRVIEQPRHVNSFREGAHLVVKLDGGVPYDPHFNETVAFSPMDFAISAGRLPTSLPDAIRSVLLERSLLILGSSLKDAHVQSLVRWSVGTARRTKAWAIALGWSATDMRFWSAAGVDLVDCDFEVFIPVLRAEVIRALADAGQADAGRTR